MYTCTNCQCFYNILFVELECATSVCFNKLRPYYLFTYYFNFCGVSARIKQLTVTMTTESSEDKLKATENARPDIEGPSKLWGLTSRDWTTRHHIARVDIAILASVFE